MIRLATIDDIDLLKKLGTAFNSNFIKTYDVEGYLNNKNYYILVNEDSSINAFMIMYKNIDYFELEAIYVNEDSRKKGIANKLISYFIDNFTCSNNAIILEVAVNNVAAISLYKKFQFETINVRKKYYNGIDAYVMKKVI